MINWQQVNHFTPTEFEHPEDMFPTLVYELDKFREFVRRAVKVKESNPERRPGSSHMPQSLHYVGRAVDIAVKDLPLWDVFLAATRFPLFTGIGVYPYWTEPGIHVQIDADTSILRKYWWRDNSGQYRALTVWDLEELFKTDTVSDT